MTDEVATIRPLVAVLDYGIGNLRSAQKALEKVGANAVLTADRGLIGDAAGIVLPGVGSYGPCMQALRKARLDQLAIAAIKAERHFLGVCIGMQMLFEGSEESPGVNGLGVFPGRVRRLPAGEKHPQMQWNVLDVKRPCSLLDGLAEPTWMYFVHSFAADADAADVVATCDYGSPVTAMVGRDHVWATQFHPEKSSGAGLGLLANFVRLCAAA